MLWKSGWCCCSRIWWGKSTKWEDRIWEKRLPPDYQEILSRAVSPLKFETKKQLYLLLCQGILIDGGRKWFSMENETGKTGYVISARELYIAWSNDERYFRWTSLPDQSRFPEVTELLAVCWLEIVGSIDSCKLSPKTTYGAYLILKCVFGANDGLDKLPAQIRVKVGDTVNSGNAYLLPNKNVQFLLRERIEFLYRMQVLSTNPSESVQQQEINGEEGNPKGVAYFRADGWMEIELGRFFIEGDGGNKKVDMSLIEGGGHWKTGLIIEGIEVRPLD